MPLSAEQQAQLAELLAQQDAPPHRTRHGLAGVLHALVESAAGIVAHRSPEQWAELAQTVEDVAGDPPAEPVDQAPVDQAPVDGAPATG